MLDLPSPPADPSLAPTVPTLTFSDVSVLALDPAVTAWVRTRGVDLFGEPVVRRNDAAPHQCRACLRLTEPHEDYLLFSHSPFEGAETQPSPYAERGPIFIHARNCSRRAESAGYPAQFPRAVVLRAYDAEGAIHDATLTTEQNVEELAVRLLTDRRVAFVHARNPAYGCFMFELRRRAAADASGSV